MAGPHTTRERKSTDAGRVRSVSAGGNLLHIPLRMGAAHLCGDRREVKIGAE
jgi:hypothetical protein